MAILVTGGAGYIGSHTAAELLDRKEEVVIVDSLVKGHKQSILGGRFYEGDLRDTELLDRVFRENEIESVIHFAAFSLVGESVMEPIKYYNNNLMSGISLLNKMKEYSTKRIVFSSTAAVYGEPDNIPILETDRTSPKNPYGETKLAFEKALMWADEAYGIKHVSLRYFNACGAHKSGEIGEDHSPETHLIPLVIQVALGQREHITIFGDDYDTKDGSCIRDYIHVTDLADAHILALNKLRNEEKSSVYNLGSGKGFSVKEIIDMVREVTGKDIPQVVGGRREGDPAVLVASSDKIKKDLNWKPKYDDIAVIIETAWNWHKKHPNGYK
ncbi:MAG: UDP-glucose 4-epimerase GalE [Bacillota bacterium]